MSKLDQLLARKSQALLASVPVVLDLRRSSQRIRLLGMFARREIHHVLDDYKEQQYELFQIRNPARVYTPDFREGFEKYWKGLARKMPFTYRGRWVYFPWISTLVHILEENDFQLVRTARNRNLITEEEQRKFYGAAVGIGGLSIGNSVALAIVLQGGGGYIRLADMDRLSLSNTNRVRAGVENLGILKVEVAARQIYSINPYAKVDLFLEGLTEKNIRRFFAGPPKLDVIIDELDNLAVKYLIREQAKQHRIAVVMAADNGDNAVVDIERYDLNPKTPFFHGRMGKASYDMLANLDKFGIGKMITKHIGSENVTERMQQSLLEMGKTIVSWPQLGGAALMNGAAVAYCVRKILNNQPLEDNRALISLDEKLIPNYNTPRAIKKRKKVSQEFKKTFGL